MGPKVVQNIKIDPKKEPKGHQSASKREPKQSRDLQKGTLRKRLIFYAKMVVPSFAFWAPFGSQESPGLDVTSPGPHFWTL